MRRFFRICSAVLAAVSLLLCLAALGMWVRGFVVVDVVHRVHHREWQIEFRDDALRITSGRGVVAVNVITTRESVTWPRTFMDRTGRLFLETGPPPSREWITWSHATMEPDRLVLLRRNFWQWLGFNLHSTTRNTTTGARRTERAFRLPWWLVAAVLALPPLLATRRRGLRRERRAKGLCEGCGYDLRATPGRCPECGREAGPRPAAAPLGAKEDAGASSAPAP
ncbi:MAG TPA: hypothetical protein VFB66_18810 [Tepidisphaeraceae bacterium]|nr:hypothetical protein [Tepidisphaeraceae bacterium]